MTRTGFEGLENSFLRCFDILVSIVDLHITLLLKFYQAVMEKNAIFGLWA